MDAMKVMCKWLQINAGVEDDWQQTKANVVADRWSNLEDENTGLAAKNCSRERVKLFNSATQGIVAAASAAQPWSEVLAKKYDKLQEAMIVRLCPCAKPDSMAWTQ